MSLKALQNKLGYNYSNPALLLQALTHKSAHENHYEKLEFLGDSILNFCISSLIFKEYQDLDEGKLSILRSRLVSKPTLSRVGKTFHLDTYIKTKNLKVSDSVRADVVEALIGAIYMDSGIQACQRFVKQHFSQTMLKLSPHNLKDPKSHLQELTHQLKKKHPIYEIISQNGLSHEVTYTVSCAVGQIITNATSSTKRHAEKLAAEKMLSKLKVKCHE